MALLPNLPRLIALLCLVVALAAVKANHIIGSGEESFAILNAMFLQNNLPATKQLVYCFSPQERDSLLAMVNRLTTTAAEAGTNELRKFPTYYKNFTSSILSPETLSCFYQSRDFSLLIMNYAVSLDQMGEAFSNYVGNKFLDAHKDFGDLRELLEANAYDLYGKSLNNLFYKYFGKRIRADNEWAKTVTSLEKFNPNEYFGVSVSNGVIGAVSSIRPINVATTVLAGAYDVFGRGRVDNIVETFPALQLQVYFAGNEITSGNYYNYDQSLHFGLGQFQGAFSSERCSVKYTYFALKNLPFAFYTVLEILAHDSTDLTIKLKHSAPDYLNNIQKSYENVDSHLLFSILHTKATTKTGNLDLVIASSFMQQDEGSYNFIHEDWDSNTHLLKVKLKVTKGKNYRFGFVSSLISTAHHQDPQNEAIRIVERAVSMGEKTLIEGHRKYWQKLWTNDIVIEGNDEDQKNVRMMLYHCYAFINDWKSYGISPMGLSGLGYNGHVFWDMDLWIYPGILGLNPGLARTLIEYRFERLQAARNNAFINGYRGAMYPWESSKEGVEETPIWAMSGPLEHHISGCVAFAAWNYYAVTQDIEWLRNKGYQILSSVAEFWQSRVQLADDGYYHIRNVVAADQWAQNVDDNAFTNAVASESLRLYNLASKKLGYGQNPKYKQISEKIIILKLPNNVTREHNRYNGENIKQADVNLLSYPLKTVKDKDQVLRDLLYYQGKIPNQGTPAMTYSIFTILYSRLLDSDNAYKYFQESHKDYLKKPFNVFAETKWGTNPYFLTGAGGVIQSMVFGFGGYDITDEGLKRIQTVIPKEWKKLTIKGFLGCDGEGCVNTQHH